MRVINDDEEELPSVLYYNTRCVKEQIAYSIHGWTFFLCNESVLYVVTLVST